MRSCGHLIHFNHEFLDNLRSLTIFDFIDHWEFATFAVHQFAKNWGPAQMSDEGEMQNVVKSVAILVVRIVSQIVSQTFAVHIHAQLASRDAHELHFKPSRKLFGFFAVGIVQWRWRALFPEIQLRYILVYNVIQ